MHAAVLTRAGLYCIYFSVELTQCGCCKLGGSESVRDVGIFVGAYLNVLNENQESKN